VLGCSCCHCRCSCSSRFRYCCCCTYILRPSPQPLVCTHPPCARDPAPAICCPLLVCVVHPVLPIPLPLLSLRLCVRCHSLSPAPGSCAPTLSSIYGTLPGAVAAVAVADALLLLPLLVLPNSFAPAPVYLHTSTGTRQPALDGPCAWLRSSILVWPRLWSFAVVHS
jgi:hypothetical protein